MDGIAMSAGLPAFPGSLAPDREVEMRAAAVEFEAVFLAEMLSHTGLGSTRGHFGGGAGEEGFSGMLVREYAAKIAREGGTGIAERVFESLVARSGG